MKKNNETNGNWSHKHNYPIAEVWNTDNTLAQLIAPRLQTFKELDKHCIPVGFSDMRQWNNTIQQMIDAFELMKSVRTPSNDEETVVKTGLELFCKHFRDLWD
ncbi:MAG: hypothetical protein J6T98_00220 [Salinivirgaceae bacterium]|nr:hypothetical protein [Salinivirgaceae bacterium]